MRVIIDEQLLRYLTYYKALWIRNNPSLASKMTDRVAKEALLAAVASSGLAVCRSDADGTLRWEPTNEFLATVGRAQGASERDE